ncbi:TPA: hypothetical protein ACGOWJ_001646 [Streptococcus suis]
MSDFSDVSDLGGDSDVGSTADVNETNSDVDFGDGDGVNDFDISEEQTSQEDFEYHDNDEESDVSKEKEEMSSEETADQVENDFNNSSEMQQTSETSQFNESVADEPEQEMSSDEYADSVCADFEEETEEKTSEVTDHDENEINTEESDDEVHAETEQKDSSVQEPLENKNDTASNSSNEELSNKEVNEDETDDKKSVETEDNNDTPEEQIDENEADKNTDAEDINKDDSSEGMDTKDSTGENVSREVEPTEVEPVNSETSSESTAETGDMNVDGEQSETGEANADGTEYETGDVNADGTQYETGDVNADGTQYETRNANVDGEQAEIRETNADGTQGEARDANVDGEQPETGETKEEGVQDETRDVNADGEQSETGETKEEGVQGKTVDVNADGTQSETGDTDSDGMSNETGDTNADGVEDETGESNAEETQGETEDVNVDGEQSETGKTNTDGVQGETEDANADTTQGENGDANVEGEPSKTGDVNVDGTDSNNDMEHDHTEKNAVFENVSYHQGQNDLGALGTCGPTSIANSLNRITGSTEYTENNVLHNAMDNSLCHKSDDPYSCGGTTTRDVVNIIDNVKNPEDNIHTEVYEYDKALSVDDLANRLDDPGTVAMVGVDSATLWDQRGDVSNSGLFNHTDAPSDHWITVDSPIRDDSGSVTGFNVIDSGGGVSYVDRDKFEAMYMGDGNHTISDPTAVLISNEGESINTYSTGEGVERAANYKGSAVESDGGDPPLTMSVYEDFKSIPTEEQIKKFDDMSSGEIYDMVKNSSESWPVDGYDKITPENAKDFIVLNVNDKGETSFNLDWPKYGGYDPESVSSISNMNGNVEVSRDGGDKGYTMGIGRNDDGSYDNNSMRSIPKSSAEVNTGTFDVDKYKAAVDIVSSDAVDDDKTEQLMNMGFDEDSADNMIRDYEDWKSRPEIIGDGNIEQGAKMANPDGQIDMKYGVHGKAAEWDVGGIHMEGGAGQMNTVFSWGTCRESGIITNCGKAKIN